MTWKSVSVRSSTRSTSLTKYPSIRASIDAGAADVRSSPRPTNRSRQRNIPGTRRPKGQSDGDWLSRRSTNHTRAEWEIVVPQGIMGPSSRTHHALAPTIDLSPWQLAACVANRPKPPRIRQSLHRCRVMLRVNVLVEPIVFHPGVFEGSSSAIVPSAPHIEQIYRARPRQRYPRLCEFWISLKVESTSQNLRRMRLIDDRTFV
jgi:hypothetical protein